MKKISAFILALLMATLLLTACGDGLSGTWERNNSKYSFNDKEYIETLVISGKTFTNTFYVTEQTIEYEPPPPPPRDPNDPVPPPPAIEEPKADPGNNMFNIRVNDGDFDKRLVDSYTYESSSGRGYERKLFQITVRGTLSLTDDKIEFVLSNSTVKVSNYSSTENTLNIGGTNFTRSGLSRG